LWSQQSVGVGDDTDTQHAAVSATAGLAAQTRARNS
jgi:hypothetical protein